MKFNSIECADCKILTGAWIKYDGANRCITCHDKYIDKKEADAMLAKQEEQNA